jgi:hypothetical protein
MDDDHFDITDVMTDKFRHTPPALLDAWYAGFQARMKRSLGDRTSQQIRTLK